MEAELDFLFRIDRQREETIPAHHHRCYELVYYAAGRGKTLIGAREWSYGTGDYALIRPLTVHSESRTALTDVLCAGFAVKGTDRTLPEGVFRDEPHDSLLPLLERMLAEMQEQRPRYNRMLDLLAGELAIRLERLLLTEPVPADEDRFRYTLNFMNEHFTQTVDFRSLSAMAGYSYDRYRHLFKQRTGLSPVRYLLARRMEHARTLLRHTSMSISAVAMESGFSSDAQFCSMFKREYGRTPGQYRNGYGE